MNLPDFKTDLAVGHIGEERFCALYPEFKRTDGFGPDVISQKNGETVEIKFERRSTKETPNFFIERISNESKSSPGGPWQSTADYFCFWFSDDQHFIFKTSELRKLAEAKIEGLKLKAFSVQNTGYKTLGYPMPRQWFEEIRLIYEET